MYFCIGKINQGLSEMDKLKIMSDIFGVTIDYIIKRTYRHFDDMPVSDALLLFFHKRHYSLQILLAVVNVHKFYTPEVNG